ncbi:MAG: LicD family protein [Bacteroides sp.]|nr:LicD family protein [Bacteroides sp.]
MKNKNLEKYVASNLRSCQLKQVELLDIVDAICRKHQLNYWLDGGTLLGAARHKGFIPWDDDLDIGMSLEDLKRFIQIAGKELPEHVFLQTKETDPSFPNPFVKLRDMNSFFVEFGDDFKKEYQKGIYLDIFGFIPYPSLSRKSVKFFTKRINRSYTILHGAHYYSLKTFLQFPWFTAQYYSLKLIWSIVCAFSSKKRFISNELHNNGYGIMHLKENIYPLGEIFFEGEYYSAPANPDGYLMELYGDYMQLPPEDKRKIHATYINPCLDAGE